MTKRLPPLANLEWLKKAAKGRLRGLRRVDNNAKLADAQRLVARDFGFSSWGTLVANIEGRSKNEIEVAAFLRAVAEGKYDYVQSALADRPGLVNAVGPHPFWQGRPQPLHVAIEMQQEEILDLLLSAGADIDGRNDEYGDWTPLMLALSRDRSDLAKRLIDRGARVDVFAALMMKDDALVAHLLARGLPHDVPGGGSALAFARTPSAIERLIELGANPYQVDANGKTPLDVFSGLGECGRPLIRQMAKHGMTPTAVQAARTGDATLVGEMILSDATVLEDEAVFLAAVDSRNSGLVRLLLDSGANPNAHSSDATAHSALHAAAWNGDLETVKLLVEAGARLDERDARHDSTPWGWAVTAEKITRNPQCRIVADWLQSQQADG